MSDNVYILGVGMTKFGKFLDKSIKVLTGEALELVFKDCGLNRSDIEAAWFSNTCWGIYKFQHSIRGQVALTANQVEGIPIINVENACAGASTALHSAWMAIKAGYDCVLAIGAEKLYDEDRAMVMKSFSSAVDVEAMMEAITRIQEEQKKKRETEGKEKEGGGSEKAGGHSVFMDFYGAMARRHMKQYGTTQRQLAVIASKAHNNSSLNPLAQYTFTQTVEQVLEDRVVSYPLTRAMCAPVGDGSAAAIVCSERFLKAHPSSRAVLIRGLRPEVRNPGRRKRHWKEGFPGGLRKGGRRSRRHRMWPKCMMPLPLENWSKANSWDSAPPVKADPLLKAGQRPYRKNPHQSQRRTYFPRAPDRGLGTGPDL